MSIITNFTFACKEEEEVKLPKMVTLQELGLYYRHTSPYRGAVETALQADVDFEPSEVDSLEQKVCIGKKCPFYKANELNRDIVPRNSREYQNWIRRSLGIVCQGLGELVGHEINLTYHESAGLPQQSFFLQKAKCAPSSTRPTNG